MKTVKANYYDGRSTRKLAATLSIEQGLLKIQGEDLLRVIPLSDASISARLGSAPRLLHFADGSHCEVNNQAEFNALLAQSGIKPQSLISRLENTWHFALAATLLSIAFVIASFYWGLPWVADIAAARIPARVSLSIDAHVLRVVDDGMMQQSQLSNARQQQLQLRLDGLRDANGLPQHQLEFRSSKAIGANAFALPGGTIVVTDQLVALASHDEEIIAVLAHELGHVSERHPLRQLLQSSVVGLAMTWYLGDISSLLAAAPTLLLESSYSRNFERRADSYAANLLSLNKISPARLAHMLQKLESSHADSNPDKAHSAAVADFFSSHPDTGERIRALGGDAEHKSNR